MSSFSLCRRLLKEIPRERKMRLHEILNSKPVIKIIADAKTRFMAEAAIMGRLITFNAFRGINENQDRWLIEFDQDDQMNLTGARGEFEVFSMVKTCVEHLIHKHNPNRLRFGADKGETSRISLYERFVKRFMKEWDLEKNDSSQMVQFMLTRKVD